MKSTTIAALLAMAVTVCSVILAANAKQGGRLAPKQEAKPAAATTPSDIPGITTPDRTPHACVDCHVNHPESKMDYRLPSILAQWKNGTDPKIIEKAQAAVPEGKTLAGKHPDVSAQIRFIPNDCLMCHGRRFSNGSPVRQAAARHPPGGRPGEPFPDRRERNLHQLPQAGSEDRDMAYGQRRSEIANVVPIWVRRSPDPKPTTSNGARFCMHPMGLGAVARRMGNLVRSPTFTRVGPVSRLPNAIPRVGVPSRLKAELRTAPDLATPGR